MNSHLVLDAYYSQFLRTNSIRYCVWVRKTNGNLFLWRYCEFLESARYYAGVARDKETEALISTWERSENYLRHVYPISYDPTLLILNSDY